MLFSEMFLSISNFFYKKMKKVEFYFRFLRNNKYFPDFKKPKTYNEKVNFRKENPQNKLFSICSDKIRVKDYVSRKVGDEIIIPSYYVGRNINKKIVLDVLHKYKSCVLKANHNSGHVYFFDEETDEEFIEHAILNIKEQLQKDFGKRFNEPWYSEIERGVLLEKRLYSGAIDEPIKDYKFYMFKQPCGNFKFIVGVFFDRGKNISASYFDEELNYLALSFDFANIYTSLEKPKNYAQMVEVAKKLAEPFSHVRVDLYNINGKIYFGELTFADGSGIAPFGSYQQDLWFGNLWHGDPGS